ncbi:MAG: T9SS type A sorting domain-containing protein [Ignavibacteriota bacterium]
MKTIIIKTNSIICIILCLMLSPGLKSQAVYDTLYSYPDTTTFYNTTIIVVDDITNLAVKFFADNSWESYQIEEVICSVATGIDTSGWNYFFFSLGELPEDSLIYTKQVFNNSLSFYPEMVSIKLDTPLVIKNHSSFFLSGGFFNILSISQLFAEGIPNHFAYWYTPALWVEYVPYYFNIKVVVKKNLTDVDDETMLLKEYSLEQNFPNPFNPVTSIQYAISSTQFVTLKVYDVLGREVVTLVNEAKEAGQFEVEFNPESSIKNPASGVYFYQLRAGDFVDTKKMLMIK